MKEVTAVPDLNEEYLRAALRDLRDSALPALRPPNVDEVERLAARRQSVNTASLVGVAVLLLIGAIVLANVTKPPRPGPGLTPTATPSMASTASVTPMPATGTPTPATASFTVSALEVTLTDAPGGYRHGVITIRVRADGPGEVAAALLLVTSAERRPDGDWHRCGADSDQDWSLCDLGVLAIGTTSTLSLPIQVPAGQGHRDDVLGSVRLRLDQVEYEPVTIRVANP
jgi:hypothetical protein